MFSVYNVEFDVPQILINTTYASGLNKFCFIFLSYIDGLVNLYINIRSLL